MNTQLILPADTDSNDNENRMQDFNYRNGELYVEDTPLRQIAQDWGTPAYVYSRAALSRHYRAYAEGLGDHPGMICYAVKANSNLALLQVLAGLGAGFDIVSGGELRRVLMAGADPARVVFSGVGKSAGEMAEALRAGVHCFNVESAAELETLAQVAAGQGCSAPVSLRVNPDVDANTHPYISTGLRENKFGIDIDQAHSVYRRAQQLPGVEIIGVDCHIGSQLTSLAPFLDALDRILLLVDRLAGDGIELRHLDLGGGLGVTYEDEQPPSPAAYMQAVKARLGNRRLELIFEPGRSIAANTGVLLTRVTYLKPGPQRNFAIVDAAMNDNIRPALYQAWQDVWPLATRAGEAETWDLVGPVCESADFLAKQRRLCLQAGDCVAIMSAGAYGFVMSSNYNSRGRAAEILVDGDRVHLARAREQFEDLVRGEHLLQED